MSNDMSFFLKRQILRKFISKGDIFIFSKAFRISYMFSQLFFSAHFNLFLLIRQIVLYTVMQLDVIVTH